MILLLLILPLDLSNFSIQEVQMMIQSQEIRLLNSAGTIDLTKSYANFNFKRGYNTNQGL